MASDSTPPAQPAAHEELVEGIASLTPEQVPYQLNSVMGPGSTLLEQTVATGGIDVSQRVLGAVEGAIGRVDNTRIRSQLGSTASETVVDALRHNDIGSFRAAMLARRGAELAKYIEGSRERALAFADFSGEIARSIPSSVEGELGYSIETALEASGYLSEARSLAKDNDDPYEQARTLTRIGYTSAQNFDYSRGLLDAGSLPEIIRKNITQYPEFLYGEAISSADGIEDSHTKAEAKADIMVSMTCAANIIEGLHGSEISGKLSTEVSRQVHELINLYETDKKLKKVPPAQKAYFFANTGSRLAEEFAHEEHSEGSESREQIVTAIVDAFNAAREFTSRIKKPQVGELSHDEQPREIGHSAARAAGTVAETDFESAKHLYEVAFELAAAKDRCSRNRNYSHEIGEIMGAMQERARSADGIEAGFSLYSLAHKLEAERSGLPDLSEMKEFSRRLGFNARSASIYLSEKPRDQGVAIDGIDRDFVGFITAVEGDSSRLYSLARHINDPELQEAVVAKADAIERRREEDARPKTKVARLAELVVQQNLRQP